MHENNLITNELINEEEIYKIQASFKNMFIYHTQTKTYLVIQIYTKNGKRRKKRLANKEKR